MNPKVLCGALNVRYCFVNLVMLTINPMNPVFHLCVKNAREARKIIRHIFVKIVSNIFVASVIRGFITKENGLSISGT